MSVFIIILVVFPPIVAQVENFFQIC